MRHQHQDGAPLWPLQEGQTLPGGHPSRPLEDNDPGVGPEHGYWKDIGRVSYTNCLDNEALGAFDALARLEGIIPALESAHAVAHAMKLAAQRSKDDVLVICLSGRGDKDAAEIARLKGEG